MLANVDPLIDLVALSHTQNGFSLRCFLGIRTAMTVSCDVAARSQVD